jgi:cap2 methyltransferase
MNKLAHTTNPHTQQSEHIITDIPFKRTLSHDAPRQEYKQWTEEQKTTIHWGQRKLLMAEIEFLLLASRKHHTNTTVIYAGAAPGTHVQILADMFPSHTFILVDPAPFTVQPKKNKIIIHRCMFTDELAIQLQSSLCDTCVLFISDVRSCDPEFHSEEVHNERVKADMQAQARWHGMLKPFKSMLKFRLLYSAGVTEYLKGDIYLPVWGPQSTTECRLVVHSAHPGKQTYNHTEHEEKMFFFNTVTRVALYPHSVDGCGLDHCYDCNAEIQILRKYLQKMHLDTSNKSIAQLSSLISSSISSERTLSHANPQRSQKISIIRKHQWSDGKPAYEKYFEEAK